MLGTAGVLMGGIVPFFPEPKAPPIKAEPVFQIGPVVVTNSMLGAIVAFIVVLLLIRIATRKLEERPGKFQAGVEFVVGGLYNFAKGSGGTTGAALFPLFAGLLIWLLVNNWLALIPGFGQILLNNGNDSFPLFRAANADFNNTLALALMVFFLIHIYGVRTHGIRYFAEFINIPALLKGRIIDFVVGIFHTIGEFAKIISLSFRLFANIYGGEILIAVILGLAGPLAVIFYGLEAVVVAVIQAFIFGLLALIYISLVSEQTEHPGERGEPGSHAQPHVPTQ
ncbi:MAG TPA: F0F1 ATP synthase subunit A [Candidatus Dormibacteraeota bacterium]|jgi:F-type H+-transporting ATPase subunit a|nr:F0F1 ATP synthase subunit A [Candidatus Dormibacteraeota bacterium]